MKKLLSLTLLMLCLLLIFTSCGNKDKKNHEVVEVNKVEATCTSIGYTEYHCDHCGERYISDLVDALGHVYSEPVAIVEEDCTTRGIYESVCARCGDVLRHSISALGHSYVEISSDETTIAFECETCHDVVNIASDERIEDYLGITEIFDVDTNFVFYIVSSESEEYIRNNLKIFDSYFYGTEYENDPDVVLSYTLRKEGNNRWIVSMPEGYEHDTTYIAKLSGEITFANYKSKEISFTVMGDPHHENVYEYNDGIVFLKSLENAGGGYYPYEIYSDLAGNLCLIVNNIGALSKGNIICVGEVESMDQITSETECYFGVIGDYYPLSDGRWLITLLEPELQEIFKEFDIAYNKEVDFSNVNVDVAAIEDDIVNALYADEEFVEFLSAIKVSSENYLEANGYTSPNLIDTTTFLNSININPIVEFNNSKMAIDIIGDVTLDIKNSSGTKIGTLSVMFNYRIDSYFRIDVNYDIKTQWKGIKLEKFDVAMIQEDKVNFNFRVAVDSKEINNSGYVVNKNTGEVHLACCVEVTRASDPSVFEKTTANQVQAATEKCDHCKPQNGASLENDFNSYYMNTLYCSDWEKVAADISKLTQVDSKSARAEVRVGTVEIPICGPVSASVGVGFAISFDAKAIMDYSYTYSQTNVYGMRLNHDYLQPYSQMSNSSVTQHHLAVLGQIETRVGLVVDTYIHISGFEKWIKAGVKAELGTYAELTGVLDTANDYHGAYLEIGAYLDIDAYYKLIKKVGTTDLAEVKKILQKYGYENLYFAYEKYEDKLNILGSYDIAENDLLNVVYYDLVNMVIKTEELSLNERSKYRVNITFADGTYCEIKNGVIVSKLGAPKVFNDTLIITVTSNDDWKSYRRGSSVFYLGTYEIDFVFDTNHTHTWEEATCTTPKTCTGCGLKEGTALGHDWTAATCTAPKACERCGATEGAALGHNWDNATCTVAKTCKTCGATEGASLGHDWKDATCTVAKTCKTCGVTEGTALGHNWKDATCTVAKTCRTCGAKEGSALGHKWVDATCTTPKTCSTCGSKTGSKLPHTESDWIIDKEPTNTEYGSKHTECTTCGKLFSEESIYPLGSGGLQFNLNTDHSSYSVIGIGSCTDIDIIVPETYNGLPVTCIYANAFKNCTLITSIMIPDSVTSVDAQAFYGCSSLEYNEYDNALYIGNNSNPYLALVKAKNTSITSCEIHSTTKVIADFAFDDCGSLRNVTIPNSVMYIGCNAFFDCYLLDYNEYDNACYLGNNSDPYFALIVAKSNITNCEIHKDTKLIAGRGFRDCSKLTSVTIPDGVTSIGDEAFSGCKSLKSIVIPNSVTNIGNKAFYYCTSLTNVTMGDSVKIIGDQAFYRCEYLASISIGNSVTTIGSHAFYYCYRLTSIEIPDSVTSIGNRAFYGCTWLESVTIGNSVTNIWQDTFNGCTSLMNVTIGNSVASIGDYAFSGCTSLKSITIPDSVTSIGNYAFSNCSSLASVTMGDSVTSIGDYAFEICSSLKNITLPNTVTSIGVNAFYYCTSLTSVTIGNSVTSIGENAFQGCISLTSIEVDENNEYYASIDGNLYDKEIKTLIQYAVAKNNTTFDIPNSVTSIGDYAFYNCSSLTSITIPDSVTSIGDYAFYYCSSLASVTMGDSVTSVGNHAFQNCISLTSIAIPNSVTIIGDSAFSGCSFLTNVTLGNSVQSIGENAFHSCYCLTNITIPNTMTSIGSNAFKYCNSLIEVCNKSSLNITTGSSSNGGVGYYAKHIVTDESQSALKQMGDYLFFDNGKKVYLVKYLGEETEITLPEYYNGQKYEIWVYAFYYNQSITSIIIPNSVTGIGERAFENCTSLTSVTIPKSVTSIGYCSFYGSKSLTIYCEASSQPSGWNSSWNYSKRPVVWGYKPE